MNMKISMHTQSGLSLVEILVALVISLFLLGGIIQVYLGNKTAYRFSDASSRIQENGRFALDAIATDVRSAGFFGCVNVRRNPLFVQNHLDQASANWNAKQHDFISQRPIRLTAGAGLNGSDDLSIMGSKPGQANLSVTLARPGSAALQVTGNTQFQAGDIVLVTNCWTSDIFEVSSAATVAGVTTLTHNTGGSADSPGNAATNPCTGGGHCLHGGVEAKYESDYQANNSSVYRLQAVDYSVQASASGSGEPALWRSENGDNQELIEGVERMLVMYGIDTDNDNAPNQYLDSANALAAGQSITALRIWLVVRSENDNVMDSPQVYNLNGADITAADRRLRQVFSITVDLRNR